jgi:5-methylcytosine-specific restriction endonuclease McrA
MNRECAYGCGQYGVYKMNNHKWCCSPHYNSCAAVKQRNTEGLKRAYKEGRKKNHFTDEHRAITIKDRKDDVIRDLFTEANAKYRSNHYLKKMIKDYNLLPWKCSCCGIDRWQEKNITLELDHIDGSAHNCKLENLRLLCPNCHSQTDTFRGKGINAGKKKVSDEILKESLKNSKNIRQALINVGLSPRGGNYTRALKLNK